MASTETIPVIDLGPYLAGEPGALDRTAKELHFALTEIGFYFIVNHGVPREKIRDVFEQVGRFHAQPVEKKMALKIDPHNTGYLPMRGNTLRTSTVQTGTKPNLNEAFFVEARAAGRSSRRAQPTGASAAPTTGPTCPASARRPRLLR